MTEHDLKGPIDLGGSESHGIPMEGFTYFEYPSPEIDASIILHFANMECIRVLNRRQLLGKRP